MTGPERDGDLLVLLQVGQRLLEELVGDVERFLVNDGLHADGGSVGRPVGGCRAQDHVLGRFEQFPHVLGHGCHGGFLSRKLSLRIVYALE